MVNIYFVGKETIFIKIWQNIYSQRNSNEDSSYGKRVGFWKGGGGVVEWGKEVWKNVRIYTISIWAAVKERTDDEDFKKCNSTRNNKRKK